MPSLANSSGWSLLAARQSTISVLSSVATPRDYYGVVRPPTREALCRLSEDVTLRSTHYAHYLIEVLLGAESAVAPQVNDHYVAKRSRVLACSILRCLPPVAC